VQLDQLKAELPGITNKAKKDEVLKKMNEYKDLMGKIKRALLTGRMDGDGSSSSAGDSMTSDQKASDGLEKLRAARSELAETEAVGADTLDRLGKQKEQIKKVGQNTKEINTQLSYSNKLLNRMSQWWRG
jgi:superfamily II DNA helicase RecQ